jgi:tetratricopeptide (TPR) repeat protein
MSLGLPVGESSLLQERLDPSQIEEGASPYRLLCAGIFLLEQGRSEELGPLLARLQEDKEVLRELRGYRAWTAGNLEAAERLWHDQNLSYYWGSIWRGDLYRELGNLEEAEGWYLAVWVHPVAHERLGPLYEEMGKPRKAAAAYERFVEAWEEADLGLQHRVETAQQRRRALTDALADTAATTAE